MSTLPPECEQLLISGYVLGNLSPAEALLFQEMLAEDPSLNEQVIAMQEALDLTYAPLEMLPPVTLRDRILAASNTEITKSTITNNLESASPKYVLPWNKILGAITLTLITTLGIANYRLWRSVQIAKNIDIGTNIQKDKLTYLLNGEDVNQKAQLIINSNQLSATLNVENLPPLPPNKVYALWTVIDKDLPYTTDQKGAILTAVFQPNELGDFAQEIALPQPHLEPRTIKKIAMTIENISAPQAHLGSIFMSTK
ncbi:anti-sigma factor [Waterburya agarophytonicola K14]|uniref:Anti-sigma factor n=1 Tax=Waterburya agarophytonicola KI4 TaxID=2874699 RepID=A0A964FG62_9CYAN|nr:anti-sigma factor [Waterburya agarophytonicola]MCC0178585.1 anti-sigma factor [Waterburya agarophytonicola KI4]